MFYSVFLPGVLALAVSQSAAPLSFLEPSFANEKSLVLSGIDLAGGALFSSSILQYLSSGYQKEQALNTVSLHWQAFTPVTLCSRQSLQVLELSAVRSLNIQPVQKEVRGQSLFCATVEPVEEEGSRELYVTIDNQGQVDLRSSFVGAEEQPTPLAQLQAVSKDNLELPGLILAASLFGGEEPLRLDMSGVRLRKTPHGNTNSGSLPSQTTGGQSSVTGGSEDGNRLGDASSSEEGSNDGGGDKPNEYITSPASHSDDSDFYEQLLTALDNDDLETFKSLLEKHKLSLNVKKDNEFLWKIALRKKKFKILHFLLRHLNVDLRGDLEILKTVCRYARENRLELVQLLLKLGVSSALSESNLNDCLYNAIRYGGDVNPKDQVEIVRLLLEVITQPDEDYISHVLMYGGNKLELVHLLLTSGIKPDATDLYDVTHDGGENQIELLRLLLRALTPDTERSSTNISGAIESGGENQVELVRALLEAGYSVTYLNMSTAIRLGGKNQVKLVDLLLSGKIHDLNDTNISEAIRYGGENQVYLVSRLLSTGIIHVTDSNMSAAIQHGGENQVYLVNVFLNMNYKQTLQNILDVIRYGRENQVELLRLMVERMKPGHNMFDALPFTVIWHAIEHGEENRMELIDLLMRLVIKPKYKEKFLKMFSDFLKQKNLNEGKKKAIEYAISLAKQSKS